MKLEGKMHCLLFCKEMFVYIKQRILGVVFGCFLLLVPCNASSSMNFVMATDANYVIPTLVTMHSVVKAHKKTQPLSFVLFVDGDVTQATKDLLRGSFAKHSNVSVYSVDVADIERSSLGDGLSEISKKISDKLIALRLLFPEIWAKCETPELQKHAYLAGIKHFLWLDSDLIVTQDLSAAYQEWLTKTGDGQSPIMSANHLYIGMCPEVPYQDGIEATYTILNDNRNPLVSGGVVFWNLETPDLIKKVHDSSSSSDYSTEEKILTGIMDTQKGGHFFETTFNCRPGYMRWLRSESGKQNSSKALDAIREGAVAIWHWDYEKKPWTYSRKSLNGSDFLPEKMWWDLFDEFYESVQDQPLFIRELLSFFASVGNVSMLEQYEKDVNDPSFLNEALDIALRRGHFEAAQFIAECLEQDASPQAIIGRYARIHTKSPDTVDLACFIFSKRHFEMVEPLTEVYPKITFNFLVDDVVGEVSPLMIAAEACSVNVVKLLVEGKKADVNFPNSKRSTALCFALKVKYKPLIEYLLRNGASIDTFVVSYALHFGQFEVLFSLSSDIQKISCLWGIDAVAAALLGIDAVAAADRLFTPLSPDDQVLCVRDFMKNQNVLAVKYFFPRLPPNGQSHLMAELTAFVNRPKKSS